MTSPKKRFESSPWNQQFATNRRRGHKWRLIFELPFFQRLCYIVFRGAPVHPISPGPVSETRPSCPARNAACRGIFFWGDTAWENRHSVYQIWPNAYGLYQQYHILSKIWWHWKLVDILTPFFSVVLAFHTSKDTLFGRIDSAQRIRGNHLHSTGKMTQFHYLPLHSVFDIWLIIGFINRDYSQDYSWVFGTSFWWVQVCSPSVGPPKKNFLRSLMMVCAMYVPC